MPTLDFEDVLDSPEFEDNFDVISTRRTIGQNGVEVDKASRRHREIGVIIPGKLSLQRMADGSRVTAYIEIYTRHRLTAGVKIDDVYSHDADIVVWHNNQYQVMETADYSRFGSGFIKASCDLLTLSAQADHRSNQ